MLYLEKLILKRRMSQTKATTYVRMPTRGNINNKQT